MKLFDHLSVTSEAARWRSEAAGMSQQPWNGLRPAAKTVDDGVELSPVAASRLRDATAPANLPVASARPDERSTPEKDATQAKKPDTAADPDPRVALLANVMQRLTGHQISLMRLSAVGPASAATSAALRQGADGSAAWGMNLRISHVSEAGGTTRMQASGVVHTGDGRVINVDMQVAMSHEQVYIERLQLSAGNTAAALEPLPLQNIEQVAAEPAGARPASSPPSSLPDDGARRAVDLRV